jgi:L-phenylalanine/L-methionine N-acetyltransferase
MAVTPPLNIRAAEPTDAAAITALINLPKVRHGTLQMPYEPSARVVRRIAENTNSHLLVGSVQDHGDGSTVVAYGGLFPGTRRRAHAGEVFMLVHDDHVGRGYGSSLLGALIDLADNWLGLRRLELDVNVDNPGAIHLYKKHGFEIEGTKRGDTIRGGYLIDAHIMGRLSQGLDRQ